MAEAVLVKDANANSRDFTAEAALAAGEVLQFPDGMVGFIAGLRGYASGDPATAQIGGRVTVTKSADLVWLKGDPIYWDRSAGAATPLKAVAGADFFMGTAAADAAAAATTGDVHLNVKPEYLIDVMRGPTDTAIVTTDGAPAMTMGPGYAKLALATSHAEAEKVDVLSQHSVPVTVPFIVEGRIAVYSIGDEGSVDINVGIANGTHASSFDSITEYCAVHFDGTALSILAQSADGTTTVAAVDTLVDAVDDTYFDFRMDCRNLADIQIYINGVNVLPASVFKLNAATGPLKLIAHIEKGANDTPGEIRISHLAIRAADMAT